MSSSEEATERAESLAVANEALLAEILERKRAEQIARGQTEALAKTLDLLAAEPELDSFVGQVLKALTEQLGARSGSFWLYDAEQNAPLLRLDYDSTTAKPLIPPQFERRDSVTDPFGRKKSRTLQVFNDIEKAPLNDAYRQELLASGIQTLLVVPLVSGEDFIGSFTLLDTDRREYQPEELELAQALAHQAVLAIQLTRLAEHRRKASVLEERNRSAREIHDTLAQSFTGILLQLRVAQRISEREPGEAWSLIERVGELAQEGLAAARRSVWDLQPEAVEYSDFAGVLTQHVEQLTASTTVRLELSIHGTPRDLPPSVGMDLIRIAQESLMNALRHARAKFVCLDVTFGAESLILRVQDDGIGFDVKRRTAGGGFGLIGMNQRAERLGAHLTVTTQPGKGTEIAVTAPIPPETVPVMK